MDLELVALIVLKRCTSAHADIHHERIQLGEVARHGNVDIQQVGREVFASGKLDCCIRMCLIMRTIIRIERIVDSILGQFGMQFAGIAVGILAVVVVDTISDIACLLDFSDEATRANRMDTAGREEEYVALGYVVTLEDIHEGIVLHTFHIFVGINLLRETGIQSSTRSRLNHIPHFRFAERVVASLGQFVIRMNLDRQIVAGIDKLNQQRETRAETFHHLAADQLLPVSLNQLVERFAGQLTLGYDREVAVHVR